MDSISIRAYAKINLSLDVVGRRDNGYHDIESLMQAVDMYDDMVIAVGDMPSEYLDKSFKSCEARIDGTDVVLHMNSESLAPTEDNLVFKGARRFFDAVIAEGYRLPEEVSILVDKKLPIAAGIAGGSGNAACTMLGLNYLLGNPLSLDKLMEVGCKAGADIPFSVMMNAAKNAYNLEGLDGLESASVAANVSGIGEIVKPTMPIQMSVIIVNPGVAVSTKEVYEAIDAIPKEEKKSSGLWNNIMEKYTLKAYPEAKELQEDLQKLDAVHVLMSGSGPTMVAYYVSDRVALGDYDKLSRKIARSGKNWRAWLSETGKETHHDGVSVKGSETTEGLGVSRA